MEPNGRAYTEEYFWIDVVLENPLNVEVTLTNLTVNVKTDTEKVPEGADECDDVLEVEKIDEVYLSAREKRTVRHFASSPARSFCR